jgi:hypothetical protein
MDEILSRLNDDTINNLYDALSRIYTSNNILILDESLTGLINFLTTFTKLKLAGKFENIIWLEDDQLRTNVDILQQYSGLIFLVLPTSEALDALSQLLGNHGILGKLSLVKVNIIVKDLNHSFLYQLKRLFVGNLPSIDDILLQPISSKSISLTPRIKCVDWQTNPIYNDEILSIDDTTETYFTDPVQQVDKLVNSLMKIFKCNDQGVPLFKLKNIFGKGNHSKMFIDTFQKVKLPEFLSSRFNPLEIEFYNTKVIANTDLIVVERSLDFASVLLDQLNFQGLIDDIFGIKYNQIMKLSTPVYVNDELYPHLKHFNFSSIGPKLNKLAKSIQAQQQQIKGNDSFDLTEIKTIVNNLGTLSQQQELIKKYTDISEEILCTINEDETFLQFENVIFELDYKAQLTTLRQFFDQNVDQENILCSVVLISIINDGIKQRDYDWISQEIHDNYGLSMVLTLQKLCQFKLIRVVNDNESFLGFGKKEASLELNNEDNIGISGASDLYKSNYTLIDKFWNLHPVDEDEVTEGEQLIDTYSNPSFTLPSNTVPLIYRIIESLYFRDFLKYKAVGNVKNRPNWDNLGVDTMFDGKTVDINVDDNLDSREKRNDRQISKQEYVIIVIIGGITRGEMSCLKYLQQKMKKKYKTKQLVVLTSGIATKRQMMEFAMK